MSIEIKLEGLDKLSKKIQTLAELRPIKAIIRLAGETIKKGISKYPSATIANSPGEPRWYERGYGPRWKVKSGEVHGSKTSETLGRRWTTKTQDSGLTVIVGNNVSYGPYVQDRERQAIVHMVTGWRTIQDVAEEEGPKVVERVQMEIERILKSP